MAEVFLSYDRRDAEVASIIAADLESAGHSVWWDQHVKGGAQFAREIDQAISASDFVVVLWSTNSIESPWVRDEAEAGRDLGRLLPVRIDNCRPPLGFRQYQTVDLIDAVPDGVRAQALIRAMEPGSVKARGIAPGQSWSPQPRSRRAVLAGIGAAAAAAAAGGGFWLYRESARPKVPPEVQSLMLQAKQLMEQNSRDGQYQAIGLYQRAVELAPNYADGWGHLGIAYAVPSHYREKPESETLRARAEAAGRRALQLDGGSAYGELALATALPFIGFWTERDKHFERALANDEDNDDVRIFRAVILQFVGRSAEAVPLYQQIKRRPLTPAVYNNFIQALSSSGRVAEMDQALADATSLYPTQASLWFTRFNILAFSGRANAALAQLQDEDAIPDNLDHNGISQLRQIAEAIQGREPALVGTIVKELSEMARKNAFRAELAIRVTSVLGRLDDAFQLASAYYFGRGITIPDFDSDRPSFSPEQRQTRFLFEPVTESMRRDPRFEPLVRELGLDRYWRESGKRPDYRRVPGK